ncbi:hypothetical protein PENSPDRAFT_394949 [Peniophora sp. CONT]|nr:hypothetical protein PENSPDRAFT_394949 [Peniophora sp. CONT]
MRSARNMSRNMATSGSCTELGDAYRSHRTCSRPWCARPSSSDDMSTCSSYEIAPCADAFVPASRTDQPYSLSSPGSFTSAPEAGERRARARCCEACRDICLCNNLDRRHHGRAYISTHDMAIELHLQPINMQSHPSLRVDLHTCRRIWCIGSSKIQS